MGSLSTQCLLKSKLVAVISGWRRLYCAVCSLPVLPVGFHGFRELSDWLLAKLKGTLNVSTLFPWYLMQITDVTSNVSVFPFFISQLSCVFLWHSTSYLCLFTTFFLCTPRFNFSVSHLLCCLYFSPGMFLVLVFAPPVLCPRVFAVLSIPRVSSWFVLFLSSLFDFPWLFGQCSLFLIFPQP